MMKQPAVPLLVSLIIDIAGETAHEEGHQYVYCRSVGEAARMAGWEHIAGVSELCPIRPLPSGWSASIKRVQYKPRYRWMPRQLELVPDAGSVTALAESLAGYLKTAVVPRAQPAIVFLESFRLSQLMGLTLALYQIPKHAAGVWLMYRMNIHKQVTRPAFRVLHRLIEHRAGAGRLLLTADSEPLAGALAPTFRRQVHVMPIPHTEMAGAKPIIPGWLAPDCRAGKIVAWWPGRPHAEKGSATIRQLVTQIDPAATNVDLVAARNSELVETAGGCHVQLIDNNLARADYLAWFAACDCVLLPYDPAEYATRTSGIFVEAIMAGKPAFVSAGTWMAGELRKFELGELVVDWGGAQIFSQIVRLARNPAVRLKVHTMQAAYAQYHCEESYAEQMKLILANVW